MDLHKRVAKLTKVELTDLIKDLIDGDEEVRRKVEFKLITPNDDVLASKQLIRQYINENKRKGFISWRNVHQSLQGAEMVLDKGRNKLVNGEEETAIRLGIAVVSIAIDMFQYADDSGGDIGYIINQSITLLKDASAKVLLSTNHRVQENMFQLILKEATHKRYDGWSDKRYELLDVCTIYSARTIARKKLDVTLDKLLKEKTASSTWSSDYDQQAILQLQLKVLERNGELEQANHLMQDNLNYDEFREMAIKKEMDNGNYEQALALCVAGEENDATYPGLVIKWKKYRLSVYEALQDTRKQKEILLEFVYNNEYEAYRKLKEICRDDEWNVILETIFKEFEEKSGYLPHVYVYIAEGEKRPDKVLRYCRQSPSTIVELYPNLVSNYPDEVEKMFINYIELEAEHARERKQYRHIGKKLKVMKDACGVEVVAVVIKKLKETYYRKPAFVNELEKVED